MGCQSGKPLNGKFIKKGLIQVDKQLLKELKLFGYYFWAKLDRNYYNNLLFFPL